MLVVEDSLIIDIFLCYPGYLNSWKSLGSQGSVPNPAGVPSAPFQNRARANDKKSIK